jgi:outer membrane protein TolC
LRTTHGIRRRSIRSDLRYVPAFPYAEHALELARSDDESQNVDIATVLSAQREMLQVEIQIAQVEAELGKALASLERAVGCQVNDRAPE